MEGASGSEERVSRAGPHARSGVDGGRGVRGQQSLLAMVTPGLGAAHPRVHSPVVLALVDSGRTVTISQLSRVRGRGTEVRGGRPHRAAGNPGRKAEPRLARSARDGHRTRRGLSPKPTADLTFDPCGVRGRGRPEFPRPGGACSSRSARRSVTCSAARGSAWAAAGTLDNVGHPVTAGPSPVAVRAPAVARTRGESGRGANPRTGTTTTSTGRPPRGRRRRSLPYVNRPRSAGTATGSEAEVGRAVHCVVHGPGVRRSRAARALRCRVLGRGDGSGARFGGRLVSDRVGRSGVRQPWGECGVDQAYHQVLLKVYAEQEALEEQGADDTGDEIRGVLLDAGA